MVVFIFWVLLMAYPGATPSVGLERRLADGQWLAPLLKQQLILEQSWSRTMGTFLNLKMLVSI
jgi:hypothetical protein